MATYFAFLIVPEIIEPKTTPHSISFTLSLRTLTRGGRMELQTTVFA
jgi:hypothetical protein